MIYIIIIRYYIRGSHSIWQIKSFQYRILHCIVTTNTTFEIMEHK